MSVANRPWRAWDSWGSWHTQPGTAIPENRQFQQEDPIRDEFGLAKWAARFPREVRRLLSIGLIAYGGSLDHSPDTNGYGTVPELVVLGGLIELGFRSAPNGFIGHSAHCFVFQSALFGGRKPGGAVADFIVFNMHRTLAVRVDSIFHSLDDPFGGARAVERDKVQGLRLLAAPFIDRVIDVNQAEDGHPLENGPEMMIRRDFLRILERI